MGVGQDTQEAMKWYRKAAAGGSVPARTRLDALPSANSFWGSLFRHIGLSSWL